MTNCQPESQHLQSLPPSLPCLRAWEVYNALLKLHTLLSLKQKEWRFRTIPESTRLSFSFTLFHIFRSSGCRLRGVVPKASIMALENYLRSDYQLVTQMAEDLVHSSSSNIVFQDDSRSQNAVPSYLDSSSRNSSHSISRATHLNPQFNPRDMDPSHLTFLNNPTNSGASIDESSLITDANSTLSGGRSYLPSSANINRELYLNLPSSPMSFSSNNIQISSSSTLDHFPSVHPTSQPGNTCPRVSDRQQGQLGHSAMVYQALAQPHQVPVPARAKLDGLVQMHKSPWLGIKQGDFVLPNMIQEILHNMKMQSSHPQLLALVQQQMLQNQQKKQIFQAIPESQKFQSQQLPPLQIRPQQRQLEITQVPATPVLNGGICARRLMHYIHDKRHRPPDNNIAYWRKFVGEYYVPWAKKRWCLSKYDNVGRQAPGIFSQTAKCHICGCKPGRGFEATFEVLPRLHKIYFDSGVVDELLYLDVPNESNLPSGFMMLQYSKAVQESVYKHFRVVHEGQLCVVFTQELKIVSWEFCGQRHEELVAHRLIAPQVNQLIDAAQEFQKNVQGNNSDGVSAESLQADCNRFVRAGCQLARNLELQLVNDLGYSKKFVRCLQIAEVANYMKDLVSYSENNNISPIESLKSYAQESTNGKIKMRRMERALEQDSPVLYSDVSKIVTTEPVNTFNSEVSSFVTPNYYQKLLMTNLMTSDASMTTKPELPFLANSISYHGASSAAYGGAQPSFSRQVPYPSRNSSLHLGVQNPQQQALNGVLQEMMHNAGENMAGSMGGRGKVEASCRVSEGAAGGSKTKAKGRGAGGLERGVKSTRNKGTNSAPGSGPSSQILPNYNLDLVKKEQEENFGLPVISGVLVKSEEFDGDQDVNIKRGWMG
ncbi:hypothetical protein Ancab_032593 [Ancistrocladus abbreviatus]